MSKKLVSRCELKKIKNIPAKEPKKYGFSGSDSSSSDSDYSISSSDSERDKIIHPAERKDMNNLYHAVANNINNKDQCNDTIEYEPKFDNTFSLSCGIKDPPPPVVTFRLWEGKKYRATIIYGLTCLWNSGATESTIKRKHTKLNERNMSSNKVEDSISIGPHCTTHDIKEPFSMSEFSSIKMI